jgi:rRNA biogenesis protein RRP5
MSFYLSLSQTDMARSISERALKTINYREEVEKLNVWVAKMNLENTYGTEQELETVFEVASRSNDSKTVYLRLVDIYERSGKYEVSLRCVCCRSDLLMLAFTG